MTSLAKPFVKWAGGKSRISERILKYFPENIETYCEPFLGGGAIFFKAASLNLFKRAVLSDSNKELINAWLVIQNNCQKLIEELTCGKYTYEKSFFLKIRSTEVSELSSVERAARFIYLNRTCFNGLYRVNMEGKFNVPFGKYSNPLICDQENLKMISELLNKDVKILCTDFVTACGSLSPEDLVYFDPPYIPVSSTSNFTSYTENRFSMEDHTRLAETFKRLCKSGVSCILSNSTAEESMNLYKDHTVEVFHGSRSIGGSVSSREKAGEIIVSSCVSV
jgi:DNA adenine methylase